MESKIKSYNETLLTASKTLVDRALSSMSYDRTEICTIVDDSKANEGVYIVELDGISFEAFGTANIYSKDQNVRVNIPNNDYTEKKFIVGLYEYGNNKNLYYNVSGKNLIPLYSFDTVDYTKQTTMTTAIFTSYTAYEIICDFINYDKNDLILVSSPNSDYGQLDIISINPIDINNEFDSDNDGKVNNDKDKLSIKIVNYFPNRFTNFPNNAQIDVFIGGQQATEVSVRRLGKIIEIQNLPQGVSGESPSEIIINNISYLNQIIGFKNDYTYLVYRLDTVSSFDLYPSGYISFTNDKILFLEKVTSPKKYNNPYKEVIFKDENIKENIYINTDLEGVTLFSHLLFSFIVTGNIHINDEFTVYLETQENFRISKNPIQIKGSQLFGILMPKTNNNDIIISNFKTYEIPTKITQLIEIPSYIKGKLLSISAYVKCSSEIESNTTERIGFSLMEEPICKIGYSVLNKDKKLHIWTDDLKMVNQNQDISMNMVWINQNEKNQYIGFSDGDETPFDYVNTFGSDIKIGNGYGILERVIPQEFRTERGKIEIGPELFWSSTGNNLSFTIYNTNNNYENFNTILQEDMEINVICFDTSNQDKIIYDGKIIVSEIHKETNSLSFKTNIPDETSTYVKNGTLGIAFFSNFSVIYDYTYNSSYGNKMIFVYTGDYESNNEISGYAKFSLPYYSYDEQEYLKQYQDAEVLKEYIQQIEKDTDDSSDSSKWVAGDWVIDLIDGSIINITKNDASLRLAFGLQTLLNSTGINASKNIGDENGTLIDQYFHIMYLLKNRPNQNVILETEKRISGGELISQLIILFGIWSDLVFNIAGVIEFINQNTEDIFSDTYILQMSTLANTDSSLIQKLKDDFSAWLLNGASTPLYDIYSQSGIQEYQDNNNNPSHLHQYWSIRDCLITSSEILNTIRYYTRVFSKVEDLTSYQEVHPCIEKYLITLNETIKTVDQIWQISDQGDYFTMDYNNNTEWIQKTPEIKYIEKYDQLRFLDNSEKYLDYTYIKNNDGTEAKRYKYLLKSDLVIGENDITDIINDLFSKDDEYEFNGIPLEKRYNYVVEYYIKTTNNTYLLGNNYIDTGFQFENDIIKINLNENVYNSMGASKLIFIIKRKNFSPLMLYSIPKDLDESEKSVFYPGYYQLIMQQASGSVDEYILPFMYVGQNNSYDDNGNATYEDFYWNGFGHLDNWMSRIESTMRHCRFIKKFNKKQVISNIYHRYLEEYSTGMENNYETNDLKNRYSIQWYLFVEDNDIDEGEGKGWIRISTISTLPTESLAIGNEEFFKVFNYKFEDSNHHKIKAVLYYNHERFESNIIEFQSYKDYMDELNTKFDIAQILAESNQSSDNSINTYSLKQSETTAITNNKITLQKVDAPGQRISQISAEEIYLINDEGLKTPLTDYLDGAGYSGSSVTVETATDLPSAEANTTGF